MNDLDRLKEMAGIKEGLVQEKRFSSSEQMVAHIFSSLQQIVRDHRNPDGLIDQYSTVDDVIYEIEDLIEEIDNMDVGGR